MRWFWRMRLREPAWSAAFMDHALRAGGWPETGRGGMGTGCPGALG